MTNHPDAGPSRDAVAVLPQVRLLRDEQAGAQAGDAASSATPVVMIEMRGELRLLRSRVEAARRRWPETPLLVVSDPLDAELALACYRRGLRGWLPHGSAPAQVAMAARAIADGESWFPRRLLERILSLALKGEPEPATLADEVFDLLTDRERDVVRELVNGLANKQIAAKLAVAERTVKTHLRSAFSKLGVRSRVELVLRVTGKRQATPAAGRDVAGA